MQYTLLGNGINAKRRHPTGEEMAESDYHGRTRSACSRTRRMGLLRRHDQIKPDRNYNDVRRCKFEMVARKGQVEFWITAEQREVIKVSQLVELHLAPWTMTRFVS